MSYLFALIGTVLFVIFMGIAVRFYGGGNILDPSASGYSFVLNFWSDLGMTVSVSGNANLLSRIFFTIAMFTWGLTFSPSALTLSALFSEIIQKRWFVKLGQVFALLCVGSLLMVVLFFPLDIYPVQHTILSQFSYISLFLFEILYAYAMFTDTAYPNKYALSFIAVTVAIVLYALITIGLFQKFVTISLCIASVLVFTDALRNDN
ncbi:MAG: hypothetical protein ACTSQI_19585 [Candidatus Helarchaeota archaeon]